MRTTPLWLTGTFTLWMVWHTSSPKAPKQECKRHLLLGRRDWAHLYACPPLIKNLCMSYCSWLDLICKHAQSSSSCSSPWLTVLDPFQSASMPPPIRHAQLTISNILLRKQVREYSCFCTIFLQKFLFLHHHKCFPVEEGSGHWPTIFSSGNEVMLRISETWVTWL